MKFTIHLTGFAVLTRLQREKKHEACRDYISASNQRQPNEQVQTRELDNVQVLCGSESHAEHCFRNHTVIGCWTIYGEKRGNRALQHVLGRHAGEWSRVSPVPGYDGLGLGHNHSASRCRALGTFVPSRFTNWHSSLSDGRWAIHKAKMAKSIGGRFYRSTSSSFPVVVTECSPFTQAGLCLYPTLFYYYIRFESGWSITCSLLLVLRIACTCNSSKFRTRFLYAT